VNAVGVMGGGRGVMCGIPCCTGALQDCTHTRVVMTRVGSLIVVQQVGRMSGELVI